MAPSDTRTIWDIICSCFSTLFACAWIAVHPNIPEDSMEILRRRIMIMTYVLLAPEMVIIWAARQHRDANLLAEKFQIEGHPSWSKAHASVLIMEGFTLYEKGRPIRVIEWKGLEALARAGRVDWPNITERKIKDRSKGDYLSKGIGGHNSSIFMIAHLLFMVGQARSVFCSCASHGGLWRVRQDKLSQTTLRRMIFFLRIVVSYRST